MTAAEEFAEAQVAARAARRRLTTTFAEVQSRLNPKLRAKEVADDLRDRGEALALEGIDAVQRQPAVAAGIATALVLVLAHRPIGRLFGWNSETRSRERR